MGLKQIISTSVSRVFCGALALKNINWVYEKGKQALPASKHLAKAESGKWISLLQDCSEPLICSGIALTRQGGLVCTVSRHLAKGPPPLFASTVISSFCDRLDLNHVVLDQQVYPKKPSFQALFQLVEDLFPNIISNKNL